MPLIASPPGSVAPRTPLLLSLLGSALLVSGCAGMKGPTGTVLSIDRKDVRSWNPNNVWLQTGSHPDTYLPFGMSGILPVDDAHGQWVTDPQDHSRFYLPNEGSSRYPREYLVEQARIATNRMPKIAIPFAVAGQMLGGALQGAGH